MRLHWMLLSKESIRAESTYEVVRYISYIWLG